MNLYEIEQDLLNIMEVLEEQGGEFTEEQLAELECTQANFKDKLEGYYHYIQEVKNDVDQCKTEAKRIGDIRKVKENKIARLENLMLDAVIKFGNIQKNGVKSIEFPTFKLSTRKSSSVEINEDRQRSLIYLLRKYFEEVSVTGQICFANETSIEGLLASINANYIAEKQHDGFSIENIVPFTVDDILSLRVEVTKQCRFIELFKYEENLDLLKAITDDATIQIKSINDKKEYKDYIEENYNLTVTKLNENISLQMK